MNSGVQGVLILKIALRGSGELRGARLPVCVRAFVRCRGADDDAINADECYAKSAKKCKKVVYNTKNICYTYNIRYE